MLDLILVGDQCCLVDAVPTDQELIVQGQSQLCQTETLVQRKVQSLQENIRGAYFGNIGYLMLFE